PAMPRVGRLPLPFFSPPPPPSTTAAASTTSSSVPDFKVSCPVRIRPAICSSRSASSSRLIFSDVLINRVSLTAASALSGPRPPRVPAVSLGTRPPSRTLPERLRHRQRGGGPRL